MTKTKRIGLIFKLVILSIRLTYHDVTDRLHLVWVGLTIIPVWFAVLRGRKFGGHSEQKEQMELGWKFLINEYVETVRRTLYIPRENA